MKILILFGFLVWMHACAVEARPDPFPDSAHPIRVKRNDSLEIYESDVNDPSKTTPLSDIDYTSEEKLKLLTENDKWDEKDEVIESIKTIMDPETQNTPQFDVPEIVKLSPSKMYLVAETLLNITTNSCPHIDKSFLQSFNKFLLAMVMLRLKFHKDDTPLTKVGEYYFQVNYNYMKKCENHTRTNPFPKKVEEPEYEEYTLEVHVDDDNNTFVNEDGKLKRVKRQAPFFIISGYLHFMYEIMRTACTHVALPDKKFVINFIEQMTEQVVAYSDHKHMLSALQKYTVKSAPIFKQIDECDKDAINLRKSRENTKNLGENEF